MNKTLEEQRKERFLEDLYKKELIISFLKLLIKHQNKSLNFTVIGVSLTRLRCYVDLIESISGIHLKIRNNSFELFGNNITLIAGNNENIHRLFGANLKGALVFDAYALDFRFVKILNYEINENIIY